MESDRMRNSLFYCVAMMAIVGGSPFARGQTTTADPVVAPLAAVPDELVQTSVYGAPACAAPGYGAYPIQTGCPQCSRQCCKDVWAGYCQEKHGAALAPPCRGTCRSGGIGWVRARCRTCAVVEVQGAAVAPLPDGVSPSASDQPPAVQPVPVPPVAPKLQDAPKPPAPKALEIPAEPPAESAQMPIPMFNPSAWKIGQVVK